MVKFHLEHVKRVVSKGNEYLYFKTETGLIRLPPITSADFWPRYTALKAAKERAPAKSYTVTQMIDEYDRSSELAGKAPATQRLYRLQFRKILDVFGKFAVDEVEPAMVRKLLAAVNWNAGTRNSFIGALGALYKWGRRHDKTTMQPTKDVERAKGGQYEPWPESALEAALSADDAQIRLAVHLLYYTGQRIGDVCKLRWSDYRDDGFRLVQQKTGKAMDIPAHSRLRDELSQTPRRGITIISGENGRPLRPDALRLALQEFTRSIGYETVPHGLRKNAVNALLERECTIAEVAAITGQTYAMVEHYAARVNNRKLSRSAILKFEAEPIRNGKTAGKL